MKRTYHDRNGNEIRAGDMIVLNNKPAKVYATTDGLLGTDATNPRWIETGRAAACEFGIFPLNADDLAEAEVISMARFKYFCGCCGTKFSSETPLLDHLGLRNDIPCPECGAWDIYADDAQGAAESRRNEAEYEAEQIAWED